MAPLVVQLVMQARHPYPSQLWGEAASPGPALVVPILLKDIPYSTILPLCIQTEVLFWGCIE